MRSFVGDGGGGGGDGGGRDVVDLFPRSLGSALSGPPEVREGIGGSWLPGNVSWSVAGGKSRAVAACEKRAKLKLHCPVSGVEHRLVFGLCVGYGAVRFFFQRAEQGI